MKGISGYFKDKLYRYGISVKNALLLTLIIPAVLHAQLAQPDSLQAEQLLSKGLKLGNQANYAQANKLLTESAAIFEKANRPFRAAHTYNHISSNHRLMGKYDSAKVQAYYVLDLISELPTRDYTEHIRAYTNLGLIAAEHAQYDEALKLLGEAYNLIDDPSVSPFLKTTVLGSMGYLQDDLGNYDEALAYYNESLDILAALQEPPKRRMAKLYNNIGYSYANKGQYDRALEFYKKELKLNLKIHDDMHPDVAIALINIGSNYYRRGDYGQALLFFQRSLDSALSSYGNDHKMTAIVYDNIALCRLKMGRYDEAISNFKQAIEINKHVYGPGHPDLAATYKNLAYAYASRQNFQHSLSYTKQALNIQYRSLGRQHPRLIDTYNQLGTYFVQQAQADSALIYLNKAYGLGKAVFNSHHPVIAQTHTALAAAKAATGDFSQAAHHYQQALALLSNNFQFKRETDNPDVAAINYPVYASEVFFEKARMFHSAYRSSGNTDYLKTSLATFRRLSQLLDQMQMSYENSQSKMAVGRRSHEIYERAIQAAYDLYQEEKDPDCLEQIFYFAEKSKGRILLETVVQNGAEQYANIPDSLVRYGRNLEGRIHAARQEMSMLVSGTLEDNQKLRQLRDSLMLMNYQLGQYADMLSREYPRYHTLRFVNPIPSLGQVRQRLENSGHTVLEYFWGEESLFALVITPDKLAVEKLSGEEALSDLIKKLNESITRKQNQGYLTAGHQLYQMLIEPVAALLSDSENLLVVPDGEMALLPFEALLTDKITSPDQNFRDLPYLMMQFDISYAPSVTLSPITQTKPEQEYQTDFLAFAPGFVNEMPGWQDQTGYVNRSTWHSLPFSKMEVSDIAALFYDSRGFWDYLFGDDVASLFLNKDASEATLKNMDNLSARYLHLATHAFVSEELPEFAGILLYPNDVQNEDGILYAHEIYNLSMNADLVVLSACDTGRGSVIKGEGIMSLSRAFRYAGAQNLLVSLWKVEDRSSSKLMTEFYRQLIAGINKAEALQQAKNALIQGVEYAHPFYWAPFILIGI